MALERVTYTWPFLLMCVCAYYAETSRRAWRFASTLAMSIVAELPSVQILVVVANIQVRTLKTEVEKGST